MTSTVRIAPPNSLLLVVDDPGKIDVPRIVRGRTNVAGTRSCIAIGTRSAQDGETLVSLASEDAPDEAPAFDGVLDTPRKTLSVCSVLLSPIIECKVASERTRGRVWTNHPSEPDTVRIVVSAP